MPKGEGSSRLRRPGVDLLEGRLLLSHATGPSIAHALAPPPAHVAPPPVAARPEVEARRPATSENAEAREAEEIALAAEAASTAAKAGLAIPGLVSGKPADDGDDSESSNQGLLDSARYLRIAYRDEPVAWGLVVGGGSDVGSIARHRPDGTTEIPESAEQAVAGIRLARTPGISPEAEAVDGLPAPEGSDLLADFLPSDRASLDRAIDRLLDGFEGLGADLSRGVEATGLAPSTAVWGLALAALEVIRRRLRRPSARRGEHDVDPDRGPGDGFLPFHA